MGGQAPPGKGGGKSLYSSKMDVFVVFIKFVMLLGEGANMFAILTDEN